MSISRDYRGHAAKEPSPVIVIVGPTGSGKTSVAIEVAKEVGGEVVAADSRTIYKGMDVGTAKPSLAERGGVPHWGFDLVEPGERFTVADGKKYAEERIEEIRGRGHVPLVVGGTGLYVDALIFNYHFTQNVQKSCKLDRYAGTDPVRAGSTHVRVCCADAGYRG